MNEVVIEGIENTPELDNLIEGIEAGEIAPDSVEIEGFFSFIKKAVRKVSSVAKIANKFGLLPPGSSFGISMLNKLASSPKTRHRVKFSPHSVKNIYQVAFLKGYSKGLRQVENYARSKRR